MTFLKNNRWKVLLAAILIALGIVYTFFSTPPDIHYLTEKARYMDLRKIVVAKGTIAPAQIVEVGAQVSGQIERLHVRLGQSVKAGDLLAEIDSTTQRNELDSLKARLETYLALLESRKVTLLIAQRKHERESNLRKQDATSAEVLENAQDSLAKARAELTETQSLIRQTRIEIRTAEANLGYTKIAAPMDGVVVAVPVEVGQTVNANQTTPTLIKLANLDRMEVKMQISEGDITLVRPGLPVAFTILSDPDSKFTGKVESIDPGDMVLTDSKEGMEVGASDRQAIYYYARMLVDNPEGILRTSMTTQCEILISEAHNVLVVPSYAIHGRNGKQYVVILKNGLLIEQAVEVGISNQAYTQVISGIEEGIEVVTVQMTDVEIMQQISRF